MKIDDGNDAKLTNNNITSDNIDSVDLSWSPDSRQIAFISSSGAGPDSSGRIVDNFIYVLNIDSHGNVINLTKNLEYCAGGIDHLAWSPDGQVIAFTNCGIDEVNDLYLLDIKQSTQNGNEVHPINLTQGMNRQWGRLSWSSNGKKLVVGSYYRDKSQHIDKYEIYVFDLSDKEPVLSKLTAETPNPTFEMDPSWQPAGITGPNQ
jgi:Tol biopolymer transport system component